MHNHILITRRFYYLIWKFFYKNISPTDLSKKVFTYIYHKNIIIVMRYLLD